MSSLEDRAKELAAQRERERVVAEEAKAKRREADAEAARRAALAARPLMQAAREFVALARKYGVQPFLYVNIQVGLFEERGSLWVVTPHVQRRAQMNSAGIAVDEAGKAHYFTPAYVRGKTMLTYPTQGVDVFEGTKQDPYAYMQLEDWERKLEVAASHIIEGNPLQPAVKER